MDRITIGIASGRQVSAKWYAPLITQASKLHENGITLDGVLNVDSMMVDVSRNHIVNTFLKGTSEVLVWIDDDNVFTAGGIAQLVSLVTLGGKDAATGLYVKRTEEREPIAYWRVHDGLYKVLDHYTPGEIISVDSAGLGGCAVRRDVYEKIMKEHNVYRRVEGGNIVVHKSKVHGDVFENTIDENDGNVVNGIYSQRVRETTVDAFPFHRFEHGITEDVQFWKLFKNCGLNLVIDTSVQVAHLGEKQWMPKINL